METMRAGRTIAESGSAFGSVAGGPLGGGAGADFELGGRRVQSCTCRQDFSCELLSQKRSKSGILMDVHSISED
jgi:hypothetical protein